VKISKDPLGVFKDNKKRKSVRTSDKKHLLEFQKGKCDKCKKSFKRMKVRPILHHKNEKRNDNRIVNMVLLCPNCHDKVHQKGKKGGKKPKKPTIPDVKIPKI